MKEKGISNILSYTALAIVLLTIGSIAAYFFIHQIKISSEVITSELAKEETKLLEKISLIYWGEGIAILSNDGEVKVTINKIYVDNNIIDLSKNPIVINPHEKKEISIPYGKNLMIETNSENLIKLIEGGFTIIETTCASHISTITQTSNQTISKIIGDVKNEENKE
jgi:hypothetical protein